MTSQTDLTNKAELLGETIKKLIPTSLSDLEGYGIVLMKSNTSGLVKNDGSIDTTSYISTLPVGSTSQAGIVQIVDNLTTDDNTKVLSAKQGKALSDMIGTAIQYIQQ